MLTTESSMAFNTTVPPSVLVNEFLSASNLYWNITTTNSTITTTAVPNQTTDFERNQHFLILVEVICILVLLIGLVGNSLVLIVFCSRWSKLKTCEIYMINLAVSDLISTVVIPTKMFFELMEFSFNHIGDNGCKAISFLSLLPMTVSALTLVIISIDRFLIVKWPLRRATEGWKIGVAVFMTWLVATSMSSWYLSGDKIKLYPDANDIHYCGIFQTQKEKEAFNLLILFVQIVAPLATMSILYTLIILELRKVANNRMFKKNERGLKLRLKRNRRATCLFLTIVTVFYICALPLNIFMVVYTFDTIDMPMNQLIVLFTLLQMIQMLNSCANPIIYSNLHTSFRQSTLKLLCSCMFTRFKTYKWGDSIRSAIRNSTRSVRSSFSLQSVRSKTSDSFYNNNRSVRFGKGSNKRDKLDTIPFSTTHTTCFEDFDHMRSANRQSVGSSIFDERRMTLHDEDIAENLDDVFDDTTCFNRNKTSNGACKKFGLLTNSFKFGK